MTDRKTLVKLLDRAAGRFENGATPKQTWFLAGLIVELGEADEWADELRLNTAFPLTIRRASAEIDMALERVKARRAA